MCDEQVLNLQTTLHSFPTRVPIIMLQRVEDVYPSVPESMQNIGTIKVENGMDIGTEEDPVCRSNVVYVPSAFCVAETAPEHNIGRIKIENDMDMVAEEDPGCIKADVHIPSAFSEKETEPEQNIVTIKVENDMDMVCEEDPVCVDSDNIDIPSALSMKETVPERKIDRTKVENDPDIVIEEGSICVKSDDIDVSKKETGLECSLKDHQPVRGIEDPYVPDTENTYLNVATSKTGIKRKPLSLSEKLHIIQTVDGFPSVPRTRISKELGIPVSTVNTIMINRSKILKQSLTQQPGRKRMKTGKYEKVEAVLVEWFRQKRALNLTINGRILKSKAEEIAMKLNIEFRPSRGWIDRFKKRSGIVYRNVCGEANGANPEEVEAWKGRILPQLMAEYSPKDIFNADECGLFYNMLPDKTYTFKGASCRGRNVNKERITVLVCANMDGTEKLPLLVVGKSKQAQCFKNTKFLPCTYRHNEAAWMTCEIFHEFLISLDRRMASQNRKILLFVDHCPAHPKDVENFRNVQVEFIPANMTSVLQPMDQGVIKTLKQKFRRSVVLRLLQRHNFVEDGYRMSLLDAVSMLAVAWNSVGRYTIANSFKKAGFITNAEPAERDEDGDDGVSCDAWSNLQEKLNIKSTFEEFVQADDALPPCGELDLDQLCDNVTSSPDELETDGPVAYDCPSVPTCSEAMEHLEKFDDFLRSNTNVPEHVVKSLWNLKMYTETVFEKKCKTNHA